MATILITKANQCENILNEIDAEVLEIDSQPVDLICCKSCDLSSDLIDLMLQLTEDNMKQMYEQSECGWNSKTKLKEFQHMDARFVILKLNDKLIGFCHFRFDYGSDYDDACVYCYELQVVKEFQRQGLGKYLMNILNLLAIRFKLYKVMLTVFKHNVNAMDFYVNKFKFRVDRSSPSKFGQEKDYEILSLKISKRKRL
ncbi:hypothetical protein HA402_011604 [Bradysia odoriphaga]|nr:hypothetical protein HA402_011604 [Bradysia odoriphaga]